MQRFLSKTVILNSEMPKQKTSAERRFGFKINLQNRYILYVLVPALIYFVFFCFYSWPWIAHFNTQFFTDQGDGFQNVWNMWWVNFSVTHLHQLPWHTHYLHYPYGTSLVAQTLNPFNGFVAIGLLKIFSLVQAFNIMVIFSFVFGGVTTFWLCHFFTKRYIPSLIGGFIFTFSSYHFAHAIGHMQLVSLEWLPLFILLWWKLLTKPRYRTAVGAALVLLLTLWCDYYYFLYSVATAGLIALYLWRRNETSITKIRQNWRPFAVFAVLAIVLVLPLPAKLAIDNAKDPFLGAHSARMFSTDIFSPFIDGSFWRFSSLTQFYWRHVEAYTAESSVYLGVSVLILVAIGLIKRKKINTHINIWIIIGLVFGVLSYGPRLLWGRHSINHAPLPYSVLERAIPELKLSGVPVRMMIMAILASAVISAMVLSKLDLKIKKNQLIMLGFFAVLFVELWPAQLPINVASVYPAYVNKLKTLPAGAVLDNGAISGSWALYDQTITQRPMALGYISRTPTSVNNKDSVLIADATPGRYPLLCSQFKIRYVTLPASRPIPGNLKLIYNDGQNLIYDLKDSPNC